MTCALKGVLAEETESWRGLLVRAFRRLLDARLSGAAITHLAYGGGRVGGWNCEQGQGSCPTPAVFQCCEFNALDHCRIQRHLTTAESQCQAGPGDPFTFTTY